MKHVFILIAMLTSPAISFAQDIKAKSNEVSLDFSEKKNFATTAPVIKWHKPIPEVSYVKNNKFPVSIEIKSKKALRAVTLAFRESGKTTPLNENKLKIYDSARFGFHLMREFTLPDGHIEIDVVVENEDGIKAKSMRSAYAGAAAVELAMKTNRKDYALIFATDNYDNWSPLTNPIFDGTTIKLSLEQYYGFNAELVKNATKEKILLKLREYAEIKFSPTDQLFIFFAGHGFYDETLKQGYVVPTEGVKSDLSRNAYLSHADLLSRIDKTPCEHILLILDVCFGGTLEEETLSRGDDEMYAQASRADIIARKLAIKTRKFITSGGKEYVPDGRPGEHSPFAKQFIAALNSQGGSDGILGIFEVMTYLESMKIQPRFGTFGSNQLNSDFIFESKQ